MFLYIVRFKPGNHQQTAGDDVLSYVDTKSFVYVDIFTLFIWFYVHVSDSLDSFSVKFILNSNRRKK